MPAILIILWSICSISIARGQNDGPQPVVLLADDFDRNAAISIKQLAAYNHWANRQLVLWLSRADSTQWQMQLESSFNTLATTVMHLWNAEYGWLATLKNETWPDAIKLDQYATMTQVLNGFLGASATFQQFVNGLNEMQMEATRKIGPAGKPVRVADIIHHVVNHATYHRGQLITMGRQVGLEHPPRTDYIYFITLD